MQLTKPALFTIPPQDVSQHYKDYYYQDNWLQTHYAADLITFDLGDFYHQLRENFIKLLLMQNVLSHSVPLEALHLYLSDTQKAYGNDGLSQISTQFYENTIEFKRCLQGLINNILHQQILQKPFLFQNTPSFRIHCPNSPNAQFFPHYHTDLALGHPPHHMNVWIPLSEQLTGHQFYIASLHDSQLIAEYLDFDLASLMDTNVFKNEAYLGFCEPYFKQVDVPTGQGLLFDSRCFHTAMPTKHHTRVSIDIRIVMQEDFINADFTYENKGIRRQLYLLPDDYYSSLTSNEL